MPKTRIHRSLSIPPSLVLAIFFVVVVAVSFILGTRYNKKVDSSAKNEPLLQTLNRVYSGTEDDLMPYLTYQTKYPSNYFATPADMFVYFRTQGGGGLWDVILTKGYQLTNPYDTEYQVISEMEKRGDDCIQIYRYAPFAIFGIDEEADIDREKYAILYTTKEKLGEFEFIRREVIENETKKRYFDAVLELPKDLRYYFTTCNTNNEQDFKTVLENFQVRGSDGW